MRDMSSTAGAAPRSPGRPRSTRVDQAIVEAVLDLLAGGDSIEALTIEAIAARAGVGKATIYRRWSGKDALLRDALRTLKGPDPELTGASVRDDLMLLLGALRDNMDPRIDRIMPSLVAEVNRDPQRYELFQNMIEPRRNLIREVLLGGIRSGELRADLNVEVTMAALVGPMLIQGMLRWHPDIDETTLPEQIVETVLSGAQVRASAAG